MAALCSKCGRAYSPTFTGPFTGPYCDDCNTKDDLATWKTRAEANGIELRNAILSHNGAMLNLASVTAERDNLKSLCEKAVMELKHYEGIFREYARLHQMKAESEGLKTPAGIKRTDKAASNLNHAERIKVVICGLDELLKQGRGK